MDNKFKGAKLVFSDFSDTSVNEPMLQPPPQYSSKTLAVQSDTLML